MIMNENLEVCIIVLVLFFVAIILCLLIAKDNSVSENSIYYDENRNHIYYDRKLIHTLNKNKKGSKIK